MLLELIQYLLVRLRWVEFLGGLQGKRWWANLNVNPIEFPFVDVCVSLFSLLLVLALACNRSTLMGRLADRSTYKMNCGKTERREESVKEFFFLNAWIFYWHEKIVIIWVCEREREKEKKEQQQTNRGWFRLFFSLCVRFFFAEKLWSRQTASKSENWYLLFSNVKSILWYFLHLVMSDPIFQGHPFIFRRPFSFHLAF